MTKHCNKCDTTKSTLDFAKLSSGKDGLQAYCRDCSNRSNREYAKYRLATGDYTVKKHKTCKLCNNQKPISQFFRKRGYSADGYGPYCKSCWVIYVKIATRRGNKK